MKFIHIADLHLDTPFITLNTRGNFGQIRRLDQREIFQKIIQYIQKEQIEYLLIAGDLYEHEFIRKSTIEYINSLFSQIPNTTIFITPGNHDPYIKGSIYEQFQWNENVHIFTSELGIIETEKIDFYGIGFDDFNKTDLGVESIEIKNKNKINILITHGSLDASNPYNSMSKNRLKQLGFDYIALGHIHKPDYQNENIVYPGSTIAMGFDELGKHGMIKGNIEKQKLQIEFIPIDNKEFQEIQIDISQIYTNEELIEKLNNLLIAENILAKIILIGNRNFEINIQNLYKLISNQNIIKIKDNTHIYYSLENIANSYSLKGIFVNEIIKQLKQEQYSKEELEKILEIGLQVLDK